MSKPIGDQLRRAINNASMSRYELCQRVALDQASMSKFMKRERGLSLETIDRIGRVLGLALVAAPKRRTNRRVTHG
jgi:plasmid maintenance system antidote protein VapI